MRPVALRPTLVLSVVTVLIWTTRIRNIWTDDSLTTAGQLGRTSLSLSFTLFAAGGLWLCWDARRSGTARSWTPAFVRAFAAWTTVVWGVRAVQIATAGHEVGFVVVHTLLAIASIALAVWADRAAQALAGEAPRARQLSSR